jgi:nucleoside phosphorylase
MSTEINPYRLEQRIRAEAKKAGWLQRLGHSDTERPPRVFAAPVAAGEKILASTSSHEWQFLNACYADALAIETEGYGFFQTAHANPQVEALVIRGISDLINDKQEADAAHFQEMASRHASAFAFEIIARLASYVTRPQTSPELAMISWASSPRPSHQARHTRVFYKRGAS